MRVLLFSSTLPFCLNNLDQIAAHADGCPHDEQSANSVAATSDSEELSGAEEIRCVCEVMVGLVSISAVLVCETCSNYFNSVGSSVGEDILVLMDSTAVAFPILRIGVRGAGWKG